MASLAHAAMTGLVCLWSWVSGSRPPAGEWCGALGPVRGAPTPSMVGTASWYGPGLVGRRTANGERFDPKALTAAHGSWRFGTRVRVTCLRTGRTVVVRINDRLPRKDRLIDLSRAAAAELGLVSRGLTHVRIEAVLE